MAQLIPMTEPARWAWMQEYRTDPEIWLPNYRMIVSKFPPFKAFLDEVARLSNYRVARSVWLHIIMRIHVDEFYESIDTYEMLGHVPRQFVIRSHTDIEGAEDHYRKELERIIDEHNR